MESKKLYQFIILGLGSIGKRHAEFLSSFDEQLICIDPNQDARDWAKNKFKKSANVFSSLEDASEIIANCSLKKIGVIANWGTLHYQSAKFLIKLGVTNLYIEKPVANSLKALDWLKNLRNDIKVIGGFQNRYTNIHEKIYEISLEKLGGPPSMIVVNGGAAGMVTNGIHFLDLSISIFKAHPVSVVSNLKSWNINPRSEDLGFWEGSAYWDFDNNRSLSINFTNSSSVRQSTEVFCPNGKLKINEDMSIDIFERDKDEILADNRVIRLGTATKTNEKPLLPDSSRLFSRIFEPFFNEKLNINRDRELIATKAMIFALIANQKERKINIDSEVEKHLFEFEWKIS